MKASSTDYSEFSGDGIVRGAVVSQTVPVIAPSDLPGGYQFKVTGVGQGEVLVAVPEGGVKEGEHFRAVVIDGDYQGPVDDTSGHNIPTGRWRDGLFDCLDLGLCHAQCWLTMCCRTVALGQILTRMKLDWSGSPIRNRRVCMSAFKVMVLIFISYIVTDSAIDAILFPYVNGEYDPATGNFYLPANIPTWATTLDQAHQLLSFLHGLLVLVITMRARQHIRTKYQIPEESCQGCEDFCCAFFCGACTVCQMARHTADYKRHSASCCTETGLNRHAPEIV